MEKWHTEDRFDVLRRHRRRVIGLIVKLRFLPSTSASRRRMPAGRSSSAVRRIAVGRHRIAGFIGAREACCAALGGHAAVRP
jgi:hypothetical protein